MGGLRGADVAALHHDKVAAEIAIQWTKARSIVSAIGENLSCFSKEETASDSSLERSGGERFLATFELVLQGGDGVERLAVASIQSQSWRERWN